MRYLVCCSIDAVIPLSLSNVKLFDTTHSNCPSSCLCMCLLVFVSIFKYFHRHKVIDLYVNPAFFFKAKNIDKYLNIENAKENPRSVHKPKVI